MNLLLSHHRRLLNSSQAAATNLKGDRKSSSPAAMQIMISILVVVVFCSLAYCIYCWRWRRRNAIRKIQLENSRPIASSDLPLMDLSVIQEATNNFSRDNKLGEGGFGPVYRGVLYSGQEVAVKRLSARSKQGTEEFRNEVELIARLQHRNLVRLLGCCVEKEEKILIYEYLPNKSLASFLFDPSKRREQLNWRRRHDIILGIARGLLYLHEDSLLKVIHRDLKASNVLLDDKLNPKISDFGLAMIHEEDGNEVKNGKVVGTYGYLAPEYAMEGNFSIKSDVFSFGVLLLEILSGRRNGGFHIQQHGQTLLRHAWELWSSEKAMEFMDPLLGDGYPAGEAWRCVHVGLLCVQEDPDERPTMSTVVLMLKSEQMQLPPPSDPSSFARLKVSGTGCWSSSTKSSPANKMNSVNDVTVTVLEPR